MSCFSVSFFFLNKVVKISFDAHTQCFLFRRRLKNTLMLIEPFYFENEINYQIHESAL